MAESVGSLYYDLNVDDQGLEKTLDSSDKKMRSFGDKLGALGDQIQAGLRTAAVGLGVVAAGLTAYAKNATDFTVDFVKSAKGLATQIGVTTVEASRLVAATTRMGLSAQDVSQMYGIFSKNISQATTNATQNRIATEKLNIQIQQTELSIRTTTEEIAKSGDKTGALGLKVKELTANLASQKDALKQSSDGFAKLGVSTVDSNGKQKDFNTILFEVADKFKAMPNGIDKTAAALDLFGRSGKDMLKVLNLGSDGIKELEKQADKLGLTLTEETIGNVNKLVQSQKDLKEATDAIKIAVGTVTAPVLTAYNEKVKDLVTSLINAGSPIKELTVSFLAFGGPVAAGAAAIAGFLGNISSITAGTLNMVKGLSIFAVIMGGIALVIMEVIKQMGGWAAVHARIQPLLDHLSGWFATFRGIAVDALKAVANAFIGWADDVGNYVDGIAQKFGGWHAIFGNVKEWARDALGDLKDGLKEVQDHVDDVFAAAKLLATGDFRGGIFGLSADDPAIKAIQAVHDAAAAVGSVLLEVGRAIASNVVPAVKILVDLFKLMWPSIEAVFSSLWDRLLPALQNFWAATLKLWNALNPALMDALKIIGALIAITLVGAIWVLINGLNIVISVFSFVMNVISMTIGWIASFIGWIAAIDGTIIRFVSNAIGWFMRLPQTVGDVVNNIAMWWNNLPGYIGNALKNLGAYIIGPFKEAFNAVARFWNDSLGKLAFTVPNWVPTVGGKSFSMPKVPMLAEGAVVTKPTLAMIGEAGTEAVLPLSALERYNNIFDRIEQAAGNFAMQGTPARSQQTHVNIGVVQDRSDAEYIIRRVDRDSELSSMGLSPAGGPI